MDSFALLGQQRLPWLDPEQLKAAFLERSAQAHPDRAHGSSPQEKEAANTRSAELNAAYQCLRESKDRLAHLLELETGQRPANAQPSPSAGNFFFALAPILQEVDKYLQTRTRAASPLAKAQLYAAGLTWSDKLMELQKQVQSRRETFETELRQMNETWPTASAFPRAAELYGEFSFIKRWSEQIQERMGRLAAD